MKNNNFFKKMFFYAGLWNAGIGITGLTSPDFCTALFFGPDIITSEFTGRLMFRLFMTAVIIFGAGYYIVSRDLMLNRGIIWLGLTSKIILFTIFIYYYIIQKATLIAALAVTGDFLWSLLFILFLYQTWDYMKIDNINKVRDTA